MKMSEEDIVKTVLNKKSIEKTKESFCKYGHVMEECLDRIRV